MLVMGQSRNQSAKERHDGAHAQPEYIRSDWHWTFGWLRRPDSDETYGYCYEEPNGDLVYVADRSAQKIVLLDVMRDPATGEQYLCLSRRPPVPCGDRVKSKK